MTGALSHPIMRQKSEVKTVSFSNKYTENVFLMPRIEPQYLNRANKTELKVLYYLFAHAAAFSVEDTCQALKESHEAVTAALAYWRCAGVISGEEDREPAVPETNTRATSVNETPAQPTAEANSPVPAKPTPEARPGAPDAYTLGEIASAREKDAEFGSLVSYLEKLTGRMYNAAEQGIVLYLYDTLGIRPEVIMGVAQYCVSKGKASIRYIEKTTMNIADEGVKTYEELDAYFGAQKKREDYREKVKRIIGAERALSKQECGHIDRWEKQLGASDALIALAYEKTVAKINKPQISYMSKILEGWHEKGLTTPEEVDDYFKNPANRGTSAEKTAAGERMAFNLDDIFEVP